MSPITLVTFIGLLVAILLFVVAALVWQEARSRRYDEGPVYVLEDAVRFVASRLDPDSPLRRSDVRRILEWEVYYLQGLAQENRRNPVETYAGGADPSVEFIVSEISDRHGVSYDHEDVREVLRFEAEYLFSIGAVGAPVNEEASGGDEE